MRGKLEEWQTSRPMLLLPAALHNRGRFGGEQGCSVVDCYAADPAP